MNLATTLCPGLALAPTAYAQGGLGSSQGHGGGQTRSSSVLPWLLRARRIGLRCFRWLRPQALASQMAAELAPASVLTAEAIIVHPPLPGRWPNGGPLPQEDAARRRLRVVAVAGTDDTSIEKLQALLRRLDQGSAGAALRVDVVCGHDRELQAVMQGLAARLCQLELRVHGYVSNLQAMFAGADLALLRARPEILCEAVAAGAPVLAFHWHAHEAPHARLLSRLGCGLGSRDTEILATTLEGLVADHRKLALWAHAARAAVARAPGGDFIKVLSEHLTLPADLR